MAIKSLGNRYSDIRYKAVWKRTGTGARLPEAVAIGHSVYYAPGSYIFIVPAGVSEISAVVVGAGGGAGGGWDYAANGSGGGGGGGLSYGTFSVSSGETLDVVVGSGGTGGVAPSNAGTTNGMDGRDSYIKRGVTKLLEAEGGDGGVHESNDETGGGVGGDGNLGTEADGGGNGGTGGDGGVLDESGGGGAAGYTGDGGDGGRNSSGTDGSGGGGAGGDGYAVGLYGYGGGGVGLMGLGNNGIAANDRGSGGSGGATATSAYGHAYEGVHDYGCGGGGGGIDGNQAGNGGNGAGGGVRIIWGPGRSYPSTNTRDLTNSIVSSDLVLHLDAGDSNSYSGSGGTWKDLSNASNDGLITGATYSSADGGYFSFDGTDDKVVMASNIMNPNNEFTFSIWAKVDDISSSRSLLSNADSNGSLQIGFDDAPAGEIRIRDSNTSEVDNFDKFTAETNTLYNITVTKSNNNSYRLYIDGVYVSYFSDNETYGTSPTTIGIDKSYNNINEAFDGKIYKVLCYDTELSHSQIKQNFDVTFGRFS